LGLVRGENTAKKKRSDEPKLGISQKNWKKTKTIEAKAKKEPLAKLKDVQAINKQLRAKLETLKAKREDYAKLEAEIKLLKEQAKAKELSEAALTTKNTELLEQIKELQQKEPEKLEVEKIVYKEDTTRINALETKISTQETTITQNEFKISTLTTNNEALKQKIASLPSSDTLEELKTLKNDFEKLDSKYWEIDALVYAEDYIIQRVDNYGVSHDRVPSYKELYTQSKQIIKAKEAKIEEKDDEIKILNDGYTKIEVNIFGDNEDRSVDKIVKGVSNAINVLSNISKYLEINIKKMVSMFIDQVPKKEEVENIDTPKIESTLKEEKVRSSSSGMKP
jgi:multidrug efflux pump subunit AcrA (membrane-fusion protein)